MKDMYNKVYVYVKHGRRWCYVGPLEAADLSSIITSLGGYHYLTTKIRDYTTRIAGVSRVKVTALALASMASVAVAYTASLTYGYPYWVEVATALVSQFFTVIAVFAALLANASYETRYRRRFELRIPFTPVNLAAGIALTVFATLTGFLVFSPLRSHIEPYFVSIVTEVRGSLVV